MDIFEFMKSQQRIIDKIPKIYGINNFWFEKFSEIGIKFPIIPSVIESTKTVQYGKYLETFKKIEHFTSMQKTSEFINNLNSLSAKLSYLNYNLSELIEEIEFEETVNKNESVIIIETKRIKDIITEIYYNNLKLYTIHPREFEKIIAELLYNKGFDVELTKQTRDNGYDILALKYIDGFSPIKYLVECKRYAEKRKVGVEIIRSFKEVLQTENANKGIIETTSYFSSEAIKKQKETPLLLDYKNKDEIIECVNDYLTGKNYT